MPETRIALRIDLPRPEVIFQALDRIARVIDLRFEERAINLLFATEVENTFDKCSGCAWFHKGSKFCAVAPQNLTSFECADRQLANPLGDLDYLEARSPERVALVRELAEKLKTDAGSLEQKLYEGLTKHPEDFGLTTRGLLVEIEKHGGYSIAQMELIGDGIRLHANNTVPCLIASAVKKKILAGQNFEAVMRWLLCTQSI